MTILKVLNPCKVIYRSFISTPWTVKVLGNPLKNLDIKVPKIHGPTAAEILDGIDLQGKTCLITGANRGIGLEITRCMNAHNCRMLMVCRNAYAASMVSKTVCNQSDLFEHFEINLASLSSVRNCSEQILKTIEKIDIVILNAGIFGLPHTLTEDSLETTFQVNYLSQFFLLMNLEKILAPDARVVYNSSESHRNVYWSIQNRIAPTETLVSLPKQEYTSIKAYNISKLCGVLAMNYLGYRWLNSGKSVLCAHPGSFVKTGLCRNWWVYELLYTSMKPFTKSIEQAACTPVFCATSPELAGVSGLYYKDCRRCEPSELAMDTHLSFRMQDLTREIIRDKLAIDDRKPGCIDYNEPAKHSIEDTLVSNYSG